MKLTEFSWKDLFQYLLAGTLVVGFLYFGNRLFTVTLPPGNEKLLYIFFGYIAGMATTAVAYFFNTNKDSALKTQMLYNSQPIASPETPGTQTETSKTVVTNTAAIVSPELIKAKADYLAKFAVICPDGKTIEE